MDYGGWYDIDTSEANFKYITDVTFISSMTFAKNKQEDINERYIRHYNIIYLENCDTKTYENIFSSI